MRAFVPSRVYFSGTEVQHAEYNPGLGCVVENKAHRQEICKRRGLVEVGNDYKSGESLQKQFDQAKAEQKRKLWEAV